MQQRSVKPTSGSKLFFMRAHLNLQKAPLVALLSQGVVALVVVVVVVAVWHTQQLCTRHGHEWVRRQLVNEAAATGRHTER